MHASKTLKQRQSETGRTLALNGAAWRRLRAHVLSGEPLCRECTRQGHTVPATEVDHRDNDPSNNDLMNLAPLCASCHSRKTQADMGKRVTWGCDADGWPLDPSHPWHEAAVGRSDASTGHACALLREKSPAAESPEPPGSSSFNANRIER